MEPILLYFLKANFAIIALYLFFRLLFYRDTFFREKRIAMLLSIVFIVCHPLFQLSGVVALNETMPIAGKSLVYTLPNIEIVAGQEQNVSWISLVEMIYTGICALLLLRILVQTLKLVLSARHAQKTTIGGIQVVKVQSGCAPFSFFRNAYLNPDDYSSSDLNEIIEHERIHIQQRHSFDALIAELFSAVFWINPFSWMFKRLIRQNLEFLADKQVLKSGFESRNYQYHLLRLSHQHPVNKIGNHFNINDLKLRIIMMNTKKTSFVGLGKYLLSLPILAFLIVSSYAWSEEHQIPATVNNLISGKEQPLLAATLAPEVTQNTVSKAPSSTTITDKKVVTDKPQAFEGVDVMPIYPGKEEALVRFISANVKYPADAIDLGISGRVIVRFIVDETGKIKNPEILRSLHPSCDAEAIRVVKMMPDWKPGSLKGKNVPVYYTLPIVFKLSGKSETSSEPLLIVDGITFPIKYLDKFKEDAIKSIVVLKDTAAIKIYGERGKNGVIEVTTK